MDIKSRRSSWLTGREMQAITSQVSELEKKKLSECLFMDRDVSSFRLTFHRNSAIFCRFAQIARRRRLGFQFELQTEHRDFCAICLKFVASSRWRIPGTLDAVRNVPGRSAFQQVDRVETAQRCQPVDKQTATQVEIMRADPLCYKECLGANKCRPETIGNRWPKHR